MSRDWYFVLLVEILLTYLTDACWWIYSLSIKYINIIVPVVTKTHSITTSRGTPKFWRCTLIRKKQQHSVFRTVKPWHSQNSITSPYRMYCTLAAHHLHILTFFALLLLINEEFIIKDVVNVMWVYRKLFDDLKLLNKAAIYCEFFVFCVFLIKKKEISGHYLLVGWYPTVQYSYKTYLCMLFPSWPQRALCTNSCP